MKSTKTPAICANHITKIEKQIKIDSKRLILNSTLFFFFGFFTFFTSYSSFSFSSFLFVFSFSSFLFVFSYFLPFFINFNFWSYLVFSLNTFADLVFSLNDLILLLVNFAVYKVSWVSIFKLKTVISSFSLTLIFLPDVDDLLLSSSSDSSIEHDTLHDSSSVGFT